LTGLEGVKRAFTGDTNGAHLSFKKRKISFVDFGEIRVIKKHEVDLGELSKKHDCTIIDGGGIYIIRPNLLKKYPIQWVRDVALKQELSEWFDKNFKSLLKEFVWGG